MAETPVTSNLGWDNFFSTTTTGALTATTTTIPLATPPTPTEGFLVLDPGGANEIIFYNSVSGNSVIVPTTDDRGRGDSTAQAHSSGITVKMNTVGMMFEALQSGLALTASAITTTKIADANVTSEKLNCTVAFHAYRNGAWSFDGSNQTKVQLETELYDAGSDFDATTNYRFNAPVNGFYFFSARSGGDSTSRRGQASLYVNGAQVITGNSQVAAFVGATVSGVLKLATNDYVELYFLSDATDAGATGSSACYLTGALIGRY